ncbi:B12-binding domain-containing radical SAM protein [Pelagibacteraceae bacterium]|nr:B12-binding domain-containing radical SAM protein [Pelagibacteraceae bacterium]
MDFIFIQAPTYRPYTGDDGFDERLVSGASMESLERNLNKKETNFQNLSAGKKSEGVLNGYLPQGGLFIAEELIRRGMTVAILQDVKEKLYDQIDKNVTSGTIAFGISTLSGNMLRHAMDIARYIRSKYPDIPIVWGGSHPTAVRKQTLESPLVDYIVWGEGEHVLPDLLEAISAGKGFEKIKGIGYKVGKKIFITSRSEYNDIERVFDLPYHLLDMNKYTRKMAGGGNRWLPLITSRGCPFKCRFCHNTSEVYSMRKMRLHTVDHIVHNINKMVDDYDCDAVGFEDELTAANDKRVIEICNAIQKGVKRNLTYRLISRVDLLLRLEDSTLKLMRDTGFATVGYGIESGSQRVLDYMVKDLKLKQVHEVDERMNKFGFHKSFNFMMGIPTETIEEMKMTLKLCATLERNSKSSPYPCSSAATFCPLPDTGLYTEALKRGFKEPKELKGWTNLDTEDVLGTRKTIRPWLTEEEAKFAILADKKIAEVSKLFVGKNADHKMIDRALDSMEQIQLG